MSQELKPRNLFLRFIKKFPFPDRKKNPILSLQNLSGIWKIIGREITFKETGQCTEDPASSHESREERKWIIIFGDIKSRAWVTGSGLPYTAAWAAVPNSLFFQHEQRNIHLFLWWWGLSQYPLAKEM